MDKTEEQQLQAQRIADKQERVLDLQIQWYEEQLNLKPKNKEGRWSRAKRFSLYLGSLAALIAGWMNEIKEFWSWFSELIQKIV
ncbi:hypothetical protein [Endozoicomonas lisbonensis]|uniref:Uncharacterized protein n=1 Tax=Endozoicomonas lisbonensis TaxID=3120522 RepID=A0ABV2SPC5_9GAMM